MPSPSGGPATINGIVYQMLWSLLRAVEIRVTTTDISADAMSGSHATLILEPRGGGDVLEVYPFSRIVQQLKSGERAWSLQDVATAVLPDLYLEVDPNEPNSQYQLITEGWMGDWQEVAAFFASLRDNPCPDTDVLGSLDDTRPICFRRQKNSPFWPEGDYTERSLFERIARRLCDNPTVKGLAESSDLTHRKLWHLLGRFKFKPNQSTSELQRQIDRFLLEMVADNGSVAEKRDALLLDLARRASGGSALIVPDAFFREHGLVAVPLSHRGTLIRNATRFLEGQLKRSKYEALDDVRAPSLPESWPFQTPLLALTGESGQGKSWSLYHLARSLADTNPVILIDSTNNLQNDLERAERALANIAEQDTVLRIERVAARLRNINSPQQELWLYLLIDGVQEAEVAHELAIQDWEEWGIVLVVAGHTDAMAAFAKAAGRRGTVCEILDFSPQQVSRFLFDEESGSYYALPGDLRETLRRPQLASLYRKITRETPFQPATFQPKTEYELYNRFWEDVFRRNAADRLAEGPLQHLALTVWGGGAYPWSSVQMTDARLNMNQLAFLIHRGLLQETSDGGFRFWHDRILNWAIALSLVTAWREERKSSDELIGEVIRIWQDPYAALSRLVEYVPMDVVWRLARTNNDTQDILSQLFAQIERVDPWNSEEFYSKLLPPIGPTVIPAVVRRIEERAAEDTWAYLGPYADCLATFDTSIMTPVCLRLLAGGNNALLSVACQILEKLPTEQALEPLWSLLQDINQHEEKYQKPGTSMAVAYYLKSSCNKALKACATLDPDWVERVILNHNPDSESLIYLAYILLSLPDGERRGQRCRARLQECLEPQHARAVAEIDYQHPDQSSIAWLRQLVTERAGLAGPSAFRALTRLDAPLAVEALIELTEEDLYGTRHWCLLPLLMREPVAVKERFLSMLQGSSDPLRLLNAFQGFEDELSASHLDVALDALEQRLAATLDLTQLHHDDLWTPLERLCSANSAEALECLGRWRNSLLEQKLTEWMLVRSPRKGTWADHLGQAGLKMLYRMGGDGFTQVVNAWLQSDSHFGVVDALEVAYKRPDGATLQHLRSLVRPTVSEADQRRQTFLAVTASARAEAWELLVEAILACGFQTPIDVMYACLGASPLDDELLAPAIRSLSEDDLEQRPGAILALGIGQREDFETTIVDILERSKPVSDVEKACLLALSLLNTKEERTAHLIAARRAHAKVDRKYTTVALLNNGSEAANTLLHRSLLEVWDTRTAVMLLNRGVATEDMVKGLKEHVRHVLQKGRTSIPDELNWVCFI